MLRYCGEDADMCVCMCVYVYDVVCVCMKQTRETMGARVKEKTLWNCALFQTLPLLATSVLPGSKRASAIGIQRQPFLPKPESHQES